MKTGRSLNGGVFKLDGGLACIAFKELNKAGTVVVAYLSIVDCTIIMDVGSTGDWPKPYQYFYEPDACVYRDYCQPLVV